MNMIQNDSLLAKLDTVIKKYSNSFLNKIHPIDNIDYDILMRVFEITPEIKATNKQYWGRELGMIWQTLIVEISKEKCQDFNPPLKIGADEPADLFIGKDAIDTKYRVGSGDSGTLKKFKSNGKLLKEMGYKPILLILREDNLPAAITASKSGGWTILSGKQSFDYILEKTGFKIEEYLEQVIL